MVSIEPRHFGCRPSKLFSLEQTIGLCTVRAAKLRKALFLVPVNSRSPKWTGGRAPKKNVNSQGNAALERQTTKIFQKSPVQKKRNFCLPKTNERADGNQKKGLPYLKVCHIMCTVHAILFIQIGQSNDSLTPRGTSYHTRRLL